MRSAIGLSSAYRFDKDQVFEHFCPRSNESYDASAWAWTAGRSSTITCQQNDLDQTAEAVRSNRYPALAFLESPAPAFVVPMFRLGAIKRLF